MWEKKTGTIDTTPRVYYCPGGPYCADPSDVNNVYTWTSNTAGTLMNGSVAVDFIQRLNYSAFAGYTDWRLPTSAGHSSNPTGNDPEIESIAFGTYPCGNDQCIFPALVPAISGTWSSSSLLNDRRYVWYFDFAWGVGSSNYSSKESYAHARAVRRAW
jgi:hypothetical protein